VSAAAALHLLDPEEHSAHLRAWAQRARRRLDRIHRDDFGRLAYRAFQGWAHGGGEAVALEALAASLRGMRALELLCAAWEPKGDRVWLPAHVAAAMAFGGVPDQRNQLWPRHAVSYEGFSELAAWVRERSAERVAVDLYSFADGPETGRIRLWLAGAGTWELRTGEGAARRVDLSRGAAFAWTVPARSLQRLELRRVARDADWSERADLAPVVRRVGGSTIEVRVHNLGPGEARDVEVVLEDEGGAALARGRIARIPGVARGRVAHADLALPRAGGRAVRVRVDPTGAIAELDDGNDVAPLPARRSPAARSHLDDSS